jgi:N-acyl homoserine lactone hydrolase
MPLRSTIQRMVTGDYLAPKGSRFDGQRVVAVAYLVQHPEATLLFDTGFPFDEVTTVTEGDGENAVAIPTFPRSLESSLVEIGSAIEAVDLVVNCHLHIDHAGGNFRLPSDVPIYVHATELAEARQETDTLVTDALALDRQAYRALEGEGEILPGIQVLPTPGHTAGHQSLVVDTSGGLVALLGQGLPCATDFAAAAYARALQRAGSVPVPAYPAWLPRLLEFDPGRVLFAHDLAEWRP